MSHSVYKNQSQQLRVIFEQAASPKQILCVPIDYAKAKHVALICDGHGHVLKQPFPVENSGEGVAFLLSQVEATARRRKIPRKQIFFGGEDLPSYAENVVHQLRGKGYLVMSVNALQAKMNRETNLASTDNLALLGIAKTLLSRRARVVADPTEDDPKVYRSISDLSRARNKWVRNSTAIANQIHTHVDRLFPGFLDPRESGITSFGPASLELMKSRFSSTQLARKKPAALAKTLQGLRVQHPEETAARIVNLAKTALPPDPRYIDSQQQTLKAAVELYQCSQNVARELGIECATHLAETPYAFLTTIPGIGLTIASGCAGELGNPQKLETVDKLCAYGGIVPGTYQTGGPDCPAITGKTRRRCNRILKYWVVQASAKMTRWGDREWKARHARWEAGGQHSLFAGARRYLRLARNLTLNQTAYQSAQARQSGAMRELRARDAEEAWERLLMKWRVIPNCREVVFSSERPLGFWRKVMQELYDANLPLPPN